jgi:hypothetical protein
MSRRESMAAAGLDLFVSIKMTTSTHSCHGYELALHHESDDRSLI